MLLAFLQSGGTLYKVQICLPGKNIRNKLSYLIQIFCAEIFQRYIFKDRVLCKTQYSLVCISKLNGVQYIWFTIYFSVLFSIYNRKVKV